MNSNILVMALGSVEAILLVVFGLTLKVKSEVKHTQKQLEGLRRKMQAINNV